MSVPDNSIDPRLLAAAKKEFVIRVKREEVFSYRGSVKPQA